MSQSIEFITTINQGVIIIPQQYQGEIEESQEVQVIIKAKSKNPHQINQLAGKVQAFKNINSVAWQQQVRGGLLPINVSSMEFDRHTVWLTLTAKPPQAVSSKVGSEISLSVLMFI